MTKDIDLTMLRAFTAVVAHGGFSAAARHLRRSQSAVSQQVRKLEAVVGAALLERDTHSTALTPAGETLLGYAHRILELNDEAVGATGAAVPRARVRFGVSEDFALTHLPRFLRDFRRRHPHIDLELTMELSVVLHRRLRAGELDVALAMRLQPTTGADAFSPVPLFRDPLVWVGAPDLRLEEREPVPLVLYPSPSLTRDAAVDALTSSGRSHRTVCTSSSLSGLRAAALAGLGVMPFAKSLTPPGLVEVGSPLPPLPVTTFVVITRAPAVPSAVASLVTALQEQHGRLRRRRCDG